LALTGLVLVVVALARPQRVEDKREVRSQGYDIMISVDLSGSMLAEDFEKNGEPVNRLQAIKPIIQAFIEQRPADRIGIVLFSGRAYTMAPLTFDHDWLSRQLERLKLGMLENGTAIGDGLGVALTRLEQAKRQAGGQRQGAFVVLMTDGVNNSGAMTPEQATALAKARGIPVYTIGAGKDGYVPMPVFDANNRRIGRRMVLSDLDEAALRIISEQTGGKFFRASDIDTTEAAFKAIDGAKKLRFESKTKRARELFPWLVSGSLGLLLAGGLLAYTPWRREALT
jgi:Ca-activated chloride channel family protein